MNDMKLLLTSNGLSNKSIADALVELAGKPAKDISIAFIPTAMNVGRGGKEWFIDDLYNIKKQQFKSIDIVDISALPKRNLAAKIARGRCFVFFGW